MTRHPTFSTRTWLAALLCSLALVTGLIAGPASASTTAPTGRALAIRGVATQPVDDASCPRDAEFPEGTNQRQQLLGIAWTYIGPAGLKLDVCRIFVGAIGGESVRGSFVLVTLAGILRGRAEGTVGFSQSDNFNLVLTVEHGSFLLSRVRGELTFTASVVPVGALNPFDGVLTTDLHFGTRAVNL